MTPYHDEELEFPYKFLTAEHLVVDLIYNPEKTLFLQKSEKSGASILNGKSMLKEQALKSWEIWNE
jgi:shikimate dehydrogenase